MAGRGVLSKTPQLSKLNIGGRFNTLDATYQDVLVIICNCCPPAKVGISTWPTLHILGLLYVRTIHCPVREVPTPHKCFRYVGSHTQGRFFGNGVLMIMHARVSKQLTTYHYKAETKHAGSLPDQPRDHQARIEGGGRSIYSNTRPPR